MNLTKNIRVFQPVIFFIILCAFASLPASAKEFDVATFEEELEEISQLFLEKGTEVAVSLLLDLEGKYRLSDGDKSIPVANLMYQRGYLLILEDRDLEAIQLIDKSIEIYDSIEKTPILYHISALINRSSAKRGLLRFQDALVDAERALALAEEKAPDVSKSKQLAYQEYADVMNNIGFQLKARRYRFEAISIGVALKDTSTDMAFHVAQFARDLIFEDGNAAEAIRFLDLMAPQIIASSKGTNTSLTALYVAYASAYSRLNDDDKNEEYLLKAIAEYQKLQKSNIKNANFFSGEGSARHNLGRFYYLKGSYIKAKEQFDQMAFILEQTLPNNHPVQIFTNRSRALNLIALDDDLGPQLLIGQYEKFVKLVPPTELRLIAWQGDLGNYYLDQGQAEKANIYFGLAMAGLQERDEKRRVDAVMSRREWEGQREIHEGYILSLAQTAGI